jgi:hypothetical protein
MVEATVVKTERVSAGPVSRAQIARNVPRDTSAVIVANFAKHIQRATAWGGVTLTAPAFAKKDLLDQTVSLSMKVFSLFQALY